MKQHTKPCKTCPFRRDSTPGELGGSPSETFVGQTYGAFWIPCHELIDYSDPNWREQYHVPQCAGVAIYRANCHPEIKRPDSLLQLPADKELVFGTPAEFVSHHENIPVEAVNQVMEIITPEMLHEVEMNRGGCKIKPSTILTSNEIQN